MTFIQNLQRRIGGFPIEYPAALLMALSVAFCIFVLPDWRFESAVAATGLPNVVGAAQPPLGLTARAIAALIMAAASFAAVWFGLRALDAKPQTTDFPAFRTADLHPDAPRRRPILAGAEFGAPADEPPPIEAQIARRRPIIAEPMPSFLAPQSPAIGDFVHETPARPAVEPSVFQEFAKAEAPQPAVEARDRQWPFPAVKEAVEPVDADDEDENAVRKADEIAESMIERTKVERFEEVSAEEDESVSDLMARLESGLATRGSKPLPGPSGQAQDELRRALGDLNRISGRS